MSAHKYISIPYLVAVAEEVALSKADGTDNEYSCIHRPIVNDPDPSDLNQVNELSIQFNWYLNLLCQAFCFILLLTITMSSPSKR